MRRVLCSIAAAIVFATAGSAAPVFCDTVIGTDVVGAPGFTCELGGLTFSGFAGVNVGGVPHPVQINLTNATVLESTVYLSFNPNLSSTSQAADDIWFYFQVAGNVVGVDLYNAGSPGTSIQEVVCGGPFSQSPVPNTCTGAVLANMSAGPLETRNVFFAADTSVYIWKDILAQPPEGHITSFTQSFHTPEPVTFVLIGTGLLGLGILGRRRTNKH